MLLYGVSCYQCFVFPYLLIEVDFKEFDGIGILINGFYFPHHYLMKMLLGSGCWFENTHGLKDLQFINFFRLLRWRNREGFESYLLVDVFGIHILFY